MRRMSKAAILVSLVLSIWPESRLAQAQKPPSLEEQLRAQYEPGTLLTLRKAGILAVAPASPKVCPARYQDGKISPAEPACLATLSGGTRILTAGEKINASNVDVDLTKETISFRIVECDSCNRVSQPSSYKSQIDFQFAKGYLENAGVSQIVDTISEVLAFPDVPVEGPPPPPPPTGQLTNNDVVRMVKAGLGDGIILSKIKTSPSSFDTSVDALVKLKEAGVSDPVIQAMHDAQEATNAATSNDQSTTDQSPRISCENYSSCMELARKASLNKEWDQSLAFLQAAGALDGSKADPWVEMARVYLSSGRYSESPPMWDKALSLGGTISFNVLHRKGLGGEIGTLKLGANEVSFFSDNQEKVFSVAPSEISNHGHGRGTSVSPASLVGLVAAHKTYRFYPVPLGFGCDDKYVSLCKGKALDEQAAVSRYIDETLARLISAKP